MSQNPLKTYLLEVKENPFRFAKRSGMPTSTIYRIFTGGAIPYRPTAKKICKYSNGMLTLKDFGYGD